MCTTNFFFVRTWMLESFGSWQYGISDPLLVQDRSVWCGKEGCQVAEGEVCAIIMKAGYQYLLAETMFLKIQLTKNPADFQAQHLPTAWGPPMGFHNGFTACPMKRLMKISPQGMS